MKFAVGVVATLTSSQPSFPTSFKNSSRSKILPESSTLNSLIMYSHAIPFAHGTKTSPLALWMAAQRKSMQRATYRLKKGAEPEDATESHAIRFYQCDLLTRATVFGTFKAGNFSERVGSDAPGNGCNSRP